MKLGAAIAVLLALRAAPVAAQAMNLSWDDCDTAGAGAKTFACDTNLGSATLYGSAVVGIPLPMLQTAQAYVRVQTQSGSLPSWWQFSTGECRSGSGLSASFDFSGGSSCVDPWAGSPGADLLEYVDESYAYGTARIRVGHYVNETTSINGTDEYYFFEVGIGFDRSTGTGACSGCTDPACLVLEVLTLEQAGGGANGYVTISTPGNRHYVTWQSADVARCDLMTPVRVSTWGAVKSIYR